MILVALTVLFFFIDRIYVKLTPDELEKFKVVYLISASFAVINFPFVTLNGILNSYEEFIHLKFADVIYRVLLIAMTVVALLMGQGLYALVTVHAIVGVIIIAYKLIVLKRCVDLKINWKYSDRSLCKDIFGFSIWVTISTLAQRLVFNITPSILGAVANSAAIAVFGIVTTIEGYAYTFTTAINGMFMPRISRIYEQGHENEELMPLLMNVGKFQYALNGLIVAGFAVVGKAFINLWMDPRLFFNSLQIANTAMIVRRKVNLQAWINLGMGIINVVLSLFLSREFGVIGACVSIFIAYMIRAVALLSVYKKVLKLDMTAFVKNCYVRMSIPILVTVGLGILMNRFIADNGWLVLCGKGIAVLVVYALTIFVFGLTRNERKTIFRMKRRRK